MLLVKFMKNYLNKFLVGVLVIIVLGAIAVLTSKNSGDQNSVTAGTKIPVEFNKQVDDADVVAKPTLESTPTYEWEEGVYTGASEWMRFQYPNRMGNFKFTTYFSRGEGRNFGWLNVNVVPGTFSCKEVRLVDSPDNWGSGVTIINGRKYCERGEADAAMGSSYSQSEYTTEISGKLVTFSFGTRSTSCGPYDEPVRSECEQERVKYSFGAIDKMEKDVVDRMAQSITFGTEVKIWTNTHIKSGITLQYPNQLNAKFRSFQDGGPVGAWPPEIVVSPDQFSCQPSTKKYEPGDQVITQRNIEGRQYCVAVAYDAGAGNRWSMYKYTTVLKDKTITLAFTIHSGACSYADADPVRTTCEAENKLYDESPIVDQIVDKLVQSMQFANN